MRTETSPEVFFNSLGDLVERFWAQRNYDEAAFPEVATAAFAEAPPCEHVSFYDCAKMGLLHDPLLPQQDLDAKFGQPPLTVYWGREFRIELLFWVEGIPGIHQHGFSGAFHVLSGSSLQTEWAFTATRRVVTRLFLGAVSLAKAELLRTGATRTIIAGNKMIHSTFHLERPSVTCVIRTNREVDHLPQYTYIPPSIAYASAEPCPTIERRLQLIRMLIGSEKLAECLELVGHLFENADTYAAFQYLLGLFSEVPEGAERNRIICAARHKHAELVEIMQPALEDRERRQRILRLRRTIANSDLQFFLALLLNVPAGDLIISLTREKYRSRDPVDTVIGWLRALSQLGALETHWQESWFMLAREVLSGRDIQTPDGSAQQFLSQALANYWLLWPLFRGLSGENCEPRTKLSVSNQQNEIAGRSVAFQ